MNSQSSIRPTLENYQAFIAAIRTGQRDIGDAARAARIPFAVSAEIFSRELKRERVRFVDQGCGSRWIEEVTA